MPTNTDDNAVWKFSDDEYIAAVQSIRDSINNYAPEYNNIGSALYGILQMYISITKELLDYCEGRHTIENEKTISILYSNPVKIIMKLSMNCFMDTRIRVRSDCFNLPEVWNDLYNFNKE